MTRDQNLHPDNDIILSVFRASCPEMEKDIGRFCIFRKPTCPAEKGTHEIVAIQKDWRGEKCYRVAGGPFDAHRFGRVATVDEIKILDICALRLQQGDLS